MEKSNCKLLAEMLPFWNKLNEQEQSRIVDNTLLNNYKEGQNVHGRNEYCTGVIVVKKGRLRAYLLSDEGKEVTLFRLLERDICLLSASCILKNISFDIYVDAEESTELLIINPSTYEDIARNNQAAGNFMTELISMRF